MTHVPKLINLSNLRTDLFIGGEWLPGRERQRINVVDPASELCLSTVADANIEDAFAAVDAAEKASSTWASTPPRQRSEILRRAFELVIERCDSLAELITLENGKSLSDAKSEVIYAAEFFRWNAEEAVRIEGQLGHAPGGAHRILVQYQPIGISLLVTPWNFPAAMAMRKLGPALAAGNTCILKPATETPLTAYALAGLLSEAGLPTGVLNVFTTSKTESIIRALLHDKRVRKLSFTGSTAVGRLLLKEAADQIINCSMELGGNAPFIIFADADLDAAIEQALIAKMRNGGAACTAANRFYVERSVAQVFAEKLAQRMEAMPVGPGLASGTKLGPMISAGSRERVAGLVADAVMNGGKVLAGGNIIEGPGYFYEPTVIANVPEKARIMREEIFGPVAPIASFDNEAQAIQLSNNTEFGLAAYVYTGDVARGLRISEKIEAGMIGLNRGLLSDAAAPFGGIKQSGIGREGSHHGIFEYLEAKYIATQW